MPSKYDLKKNFQIEEEQEEKFAKVNSNYPTRSVKTYHPLHTIAVDLIDLSKDTQFKCSYIMIAIDLFSRKVFYDFMRHKNIDAIGQGFERIFKQMNGTPYFIWTDGEGAIYSHKIQDYLAEEHDITTYQTYGKVHNPVAERVIRTLKEIVEKVKVPLRKKNPKMPLEKIFELAVEIYNKTPHGSTGQRPNDAFEDESLLKPVHERNKETVEFVKFQGNKFKVGDIVLLELPKQTFKKGYKQKFSDDEYTVIERKNTNPETYTIQKNDEPDVKLSNIYTQQLKLADRIINIGDEEDPMNRKIVERKYKK